MGDETEKCEKAFELYVFEDRHKNTCVRITQGVDVFGPVAVPVSIHNALMEIANYVEKLSKRKRAKVANEDQQ